MLSWKKSNNGFFTVVGSAVGKITQKKRLRRKSEGREKEGKERGGISGIA